jgi:GH15 family glucan-1,4-alpha-glucosidase
MSPATLSDYGFLSDCHSAALVSTAGSIDWWCLPRFDSPAVFARLLDKAAGHWSLRPVAPFEIERGYLGDSLVLRTVFHTREGSLAVTDALALVPGARGHAIGHDSPHTLLRRVDGLAGEVEIETELVPRFEYGLTVPRFTIDRGAVLARVGPVELRLAGDIEMTLGGGAAPGRRVLAAGETCELRLTYRATFARPPRRSPLRRWLPARRRDLLAETLRAWESWSETHSGYQGRYAEQVRRSALVLQGLTYQPSGAVIAAATTSLPELLGGELNWDYRYVWLRDMALTIQAQWVAACPHEADRFFTWVARSMGQLGHKPLQIMYGVEGERLLPEYQLDHLAGYRGSRPVRVGNDASGQRQLDVLGEVLFAAELLGDEIGEFSGEMRELLVAIANQAVEDWCEPGAGMWEARDAQRPYTSAKVMCWVALDRAITLAERLGPGADVPRWTRAREQVREAVLAQAWSEDLGAFAGALGSDRLDASVLLLPLVGFLPAGDPRMLATIRAIEKHLTADGMVYRWRGDTAGFIICSFWLVECLALAGETQRAAALFERVSARANDLGLLAEEIDPDTGEQIGNYPQAFSHVGLINAAWRLTECDAAIHPPSAHHPARTGTRRTGIRRTPPPPAVADHAGPREGITQGRPAPRSWWRARRNRHRRR